MNGVTNKYIQELELGRKEIYTKKRLCLIPNCKRTAIMNSHVLQRKKILEKIVDSSNKFYVLNKQSIFNAAPITPQKLGYKESYIFAGFCQECDSTFFSEIEKKPLDLSSDRTKVLFAYRTLCLEFRKREIYHEQMSYLAKHTKENGPVKLYYFDLDPSHQALLDLAFFKDELELEIYQNKSRFSHYYLKLPQKKVCFSSALSIEDKSNPKTLEYDEYGFSNLKPLVSSFINYFPYDDDSFFLATFHKDYPCEWTKNILERLRSSESNKLISDFITYRVDFWAMSPDIYEPWSSEKKSKFSQEILDNIDNHSFKINSNFSIWD
jgi:hypothetical protein